jgi:hypothetical protein
MDLRTGKRGRLIPITRSIGSGCSRKEKGRLCEQHGDKRAATLQREHVKGITSRKRLGGSIPSKSERTPAKFDSFVKAEIARWSSILKAANVGEK